MDYQHQLLMEGGERDAQDSPGNDSQPNKDSGEGDRLHDQYDNDDNVAIAAPDEALINQEESQGQQEVIGIG